MDYGAIVFDDISSGKKEGWACKTPDFRPHRISIESIGNTTIWLTSATHEELRNLNIQNHVFLKPNSYLRATTQQIMRAMGASNMSADMQAFCLANILFNMVRYYYKFVTNYSHPGVSFDQLEIPLSDMRGGVRELYDMDYPVIPATRYALEKAVVEYITCESPYARFNTREVRSVCVWIPKMTHTHHVLSQPVPIDARASKISVPRAGVKGEDIIQESLSPDCPPRLFRVDLFEISQTDLAHLFAVGNGTFKRKNIMGRKLSTSYSLRQWLTHADLIMLSRFADINVREVLEFPNFTSHITKKHNQNFVNDEELSTQRRMGFSSGFFSEILWMGASGSLINVQNSEIKKNYFNAATPFIRAYDRITCLALAVQAKVKYGLDATSYGTGKIMFLSPLEDIPKIFDFCMENALLCDIHYGDGLPQIEFYGEDDSIKDLQQVIYYGSMQDLVAFDNAITNLEFEE